MMRMPWYERAVGIKTAAARVAFVRRCRNRELSKFISRCHRELVPGTGDYVYEFSTHGLIQKFGGVTCSAVYILIRGRQVAYVGQSQDLIGRVRQHQVNGRPFNRAMCIPCAKAELKDIEAYWIRRLSPTDNIRQPAEAQ
jgi:hypothetical protein